MGQVGIVLCLHAVLNSVLLIVVGDRFGLAFNISATVPDTCGVAIDVPLRVV